jgi:hypothetical protein
MIRIRNAIMVIDRLIDKASSKLKKSRSRYYRQVFTMIIAMSNTNLTTAYTLLMKLSMPRGGVYFPSFYLMSRISL